MLTYKVYIKPKDGDQFKSEKFKGFILQAQEINGYPIGNFLTDGRGDAKFLNCHDTLQATLINANWKSKSLVGFYWFAPVNFYPGNENVYFTGSIIKDEKTYWINVKSGGNPVTVISSSIIPLICVFIINYLLS